MTNEEFYKDELKEIMYKTFLNTLAVDKNGKIGTCGETRCSDCIFDAKGCTSKAEQWLKQEHVEQVDWSKVEVDTPIYVRNSANEKWIPAYFSMYKDDNGMVYAWSNGRTSFTARDIDVSWMYAKLAESED